MHRHLPAFKFLLPVLPISLMYLLPCQLLPAQEPERINTDTISIFIIAGQSNALNIHADAEELQKTIIDTTVRFYYHLGVPPGKNLPVPFFSTSNNKWTTLGIQKQNPFVGSYEYFFGPEITLINSLGKIYRNSAVIKCAYGGSNLAMDWKPGAVNGNMLYKTMIGQIRNACSILDSCGLSYSFSGFFWIQGEADAASASYAQAYLNNLKEFISSVRTDLNNPHMAFVISRLPSVQPYAHLNLVRDAQEKITRHVENTKWIDTDSLEVGSDKVHFTSSGVQGLGRLLAEAFINTSTSVKAGPSLTIPGGFSLMQNYPNPFNPNTTICYKIPEGLSVKLKIYNNLGREVGIIQNEFKPAGSYTVRFNAAGLPSGVYFYRLEAGEYSDIKKFILIE